MKVPDECLKWIVLHRTHLYVRSIEEDFNGMEPYLPSECSSILDIGCGMAGIDVLLARRYPHAQLHLLDGDGDESNFRGGMKPSMLPFNSRGAADQLLAANGVTKQVWHDIGTQDLKADLVISLLSWGWHYPLETYRVRAKTTIADVREKRAGTCILVHPNFKGYRYVW